MLKLRQARPRRVLLSVLAATTAATALATAAPSAFATFPGANGDLYFKQPGVAPNTTELVRVGFSGTRTVVGRATADATAAFGGQTISTEFSPDGTRALLWSTSQIATTAIGGGDLRMVPVDLSNPAEHDPDGIRNAFWMPDGSIFFSTVASGDWSSWDPDAPGRGFVVRPDGSGQELLPSIQYTPRAVSPDGTEFAFIMKPPGMQGTYIATQRTDGALGLSAVPGSGEAKTVEYSPDGRYLLYREGYSIQSFERATGQSRQLLMTINLQSPTFSPDCTKVSYHEFATHLGADGVIMDLAMGALEVIRTGPDGSAETPTYAPVPGPAPHCDLSRFPVRGTALTPAPPAPKDLSAPSTQVAKFKTTVIKALTRGIKLRVQVGEASSLKADLIFIGKRLPKSLRSLQRNAASGVGKSLAGASASLAAPGEVSVTIKLRPAVRKALKRLRKGQFGVRVVVTDAAGNGTTTTRAIKLR